MHGLQGTQGSSKGSGPLYLGFSASGPCAARPRHGFLAHTSDHHAAYRLVEPPRVWMVPATEKEKHLVPLLATGALRGSVLTGTWPR